jgi:hypothetical protein
VTVVLCVVVLTFGSGTVVWVVVVVREVSTATGGPKSTGTYTAQAATHRLRSKTKVEMYAATIIFLFITASMLHD